MLEEGDCVVAGVSGGADSVCLLFVLMELREKIPMEIRAVHVNHQIRADASADASYVERLCGENGIPFTLVTEDVGALAAHRYISVEEAGRDVRYAAFERELGTGKGKIAVAHNKNDCCETFLFHLFRGSSLKGLSGIPPVRGNIIRPLLCVERGEIEDYLRDKGISYCIDSTNLEDNYTRNKIRRHILETAVREVSPAAVEHIADACGRVREAYDLIEELTRQGCARCVRPLPGGACHIEEKEFAALHSTVQGYVVMEALAGVAGNRKDLTSVHVRQVQELMGNQCGRQARLPYHMRAERDYTGIRLFVCGQGTEQKTYPEMKLSDAQRARLLAGETLAIPLDKCRILRAKVAQKDTFDIDWQNIPQKKYTKWFNYDKIENGIAIRTRRAGDYLTFDPMDQRKTLKSYFIDNKVPQARREETLLVTDGSHVLWVIGGRISSYYKVSQDTARVLELALVEETDNSMALPN